MLLSAPLPCPVRDGKPVQWRLHPTNGSVNRLTKCLAVAKAALFPASDVSPMCPGLDLLVDGRYAIVRFLL